MSLPRILSLIGFAVFATQAFAHGPGSILFQEEQPVSPQELKSDTAKVIGFLSNNGQNLTRDGSGYPWGVSFDVNIQTRYELHTPTESSSNFLATERGNTTAILIQPDGSQRKVVGAFRADRADADFIGNEVMLKSRGRTIVRKNFSSSAEVVALYVERMSPDTLDITRHNISLQEYTITLGVREFRYKSGLLGLMDAAIPNSITDLTKYAVELFTFEDGYIIKIENGWRRQVPIQTRAKVMKLGNHQVIQVTFTTNPKEALKRSLATTHISGDPQVGALTPFDFISLIKTQESGNYELREVPGRSVGTTELRPFRREIPQFNCRVLSE